MLVEQPLWWDPVSQLVPAVLVREGESLEQCLTVLCFRITGFVKPTDFRLLLV